MSPFPPHLSPSPFPELSRPRHFSKVVHPMPKAVYHSGFCDTANKLSTVEFDPRIWHTSSVTPQTTATCPATLTTCVVPDVILICDGPSMTSPRYSGCSQVNDSEPTTGHLYEDLSDLLNNRPT